MYPKNISYNKTGLRINKTKQGETIEQMLEKLGKNEPIKQTAPLLYYDRAEGVRPETDIRTDRFDVAIEASSKIKSSYQARRDEAAKERENKTTPPLQNDPGEQGKA